MERIENLAKMVRAYAAEYECTLSSALQDLVGDGEIAQDEIFKVRVKLGLSKG